MSSNTTVEGYYIIPQSYYNQHAKQDMSVLKKLTSGIAGFGLFVFAVTTILPAFKESLGT